MVFRCYFFVKGFLLGFFKEIDDFRIGLENVRVRIRVFCFIRENGSY